MADASLLNIYSCLYDVDEFRSLNEQMSFGEYLEKCKENPSLARNAYQYCHDMIVSEGTEEFKENRTTLTRYLFFSNNNICPIFGLEKPISEVVNYIKGGAGGYGAERRLLLLRGPVGSSKSTIAKRIKVGLEDYSRTDAGAWYTYMWVNLPTEVEDGEPPLYTQGTDLSPMNENPIKLMPESIRKDFIEVLNEELNKKGNPYNYKLDVSGDLNPRCKFFMNKLLAKYNGDWGTVVSKHIKVVRRTFSEIDRVGIGTFQPKDEKNQDSTELTGDMNFSKIGQFGSDSDPRAFNFDGEFQVANRGLLEFIEILKLDNAFLYDLLGATQEHTIKPKKFSQVNIDQVIISHTNNPEYEKLQADKYMEALRDRTIKVDIPYLLKWSDETKIYEYCYGPDKVRQHIMPHTLKIAALFAVLTRLSDDPDGKIGVLKKAKLYDGQHLPGWTSDSIKELRDKDTNEGFNGLSARYVQDKISNCLAKNMEYINVFHVLNELKNGLSDSSLINSPESKEHFENCIDAATKELDDILKEEVQQALIADEGAIERMYNKYLDNLVAYVNNERLSDPITGKDIPPDEAFMRSIEEKAGIPEQGCDDFRRSIASFIGTLATKGQSFSWESNTELASALKKKMFEDVKHTIKLSSITTEASKVDPDLQEKIDAIKTRLIKNSGYNEKSATDVLNYVSSIFARGDIA